MFIYNVTIKVHWDIEKEWLNWMKTIHIKAVLDTNCFTDYKMVKLLEIEEDEGPTYAIQYYFEKMEIYKKYIDNYSTKLRQDSVDKFGNKFIGFRTLMQIV